MSHDHDHHHHHAHHHPPGLHDAPRDDWAAMGGFLELEAEVLAPFLDEAMAVLTRLHPRATRVADIGCGPGSATTALARAFPNASVLALDRSPELLEMVRSRAQRLGVGGRVTTRTGDLEALRGAMGGLDIAWAGMVLHHLVDLPRVLAELHGALAGGGLLAVVEFGAPTRTLPADLGFGAPGFVQRIQDVVEAAREAHLPAGATKIDWPVLLRAAGFTLVESRALRVDLPAPLGMRAREWVAQGLVRSERALEGKLSAEDRATLRVLTDPHDARSVMKRGDVEVHAGRAMFIGRKD